MFLFLVHTSAVSSIGSDSTLIGTALDEGSSNAGSSSSSISSGTCFFFFGLAFPFFRFFFPGDGFGVAWLSRHKESYLFICLQNRMER